MMPRKIKKNKGFSPIELIFYIALFTALSLVIIDAMLVMVKTFRETTINTELVQGANVMERITREIRSADSISSISSTDLLLNTTDESNNAKTLEFRQNGNNLELLENGSSVGFLNTPNLTVSSLTFTQITTTVGTGVKVSFNLTTTRYGSTRTEPFYSTVVLRGDY